MQITFGEANNGCLFQMDLGSTKARNTMIFFPRAGFTYTLGELLFRALDYERFLNVTQTQSTHLLRLMHILFCNARWRQT